MIFNYGLMLQIIYKQKLINSLKQRLIFFPSCKPTIF